MNLRNQQITVSELLRHPQAYALLRREFPEIMGSPLVAFAGAMPLSMVLHYAKDRYPSEKLNRVLAQLEQLP